jgi:hypothetical protein
MSKGHTENEESVEALGEKLSNYSQEITDILKSIDLDTDQREEVSEVFNSVTDEVETFPGMTIKDLDNVLEEHLQEGLDKIDGIPEKGKKELMGIGNKIISHVIDFVKDGMESSKGDIDKFTKNCIKHACEALKSIFATVGKIITGEQTKKEGIQDINNTLKETGSKIAKSVGKLKTSFVEKMGGKKDHEKKTHVEKVGGKKGHDKKTHVEKVSEKSSSTSKGRD